MSPRARRDRLLMTLENQETVLELHPQRVEIRGEPVPDT